MDNRKADYTNSGALFTNDRKTNPNQPQYKGEAEVECPCCQAKSKFWLSAWIKEARSGGKFFSIAFSPKEQRPSAASDFDDPLASPASAAKPQLKKNANGQWDITNPPADFDDDVPF